jgi:hypothetical protein
MMRACTPSLSIAVLALSAFGCNDQKSPGIHAADDAGAAMVVDAASLAPAVAIPTPSASVLAMINPNGLPAYTGPTGSLEGTIAYAGPPPKITPTRADPTKCPHAEEVYGREFRLGSDAQGGKELGDAIVAITGYEVFVPEKQEGVAANIDGCATPSRTIAMTFGQRIEVKNTGPEIFAPQIDRATNGALMVAVPRAPNPIFLYPRKPGRYRMDDQMAHSFFVDDVFVMLQPLHAVTDARGHYRIDGIPVGKLKVNATHPAFANVAADKPVEIMAGVVGRADLLITRSAADAGAAAPAMSGPPPGAPR